MTALLYTLRLFTVLTLTLLSKPFVYAWINYPPEGTATLTHYDLPKVYPNCPVAVGSRYLIYRTGLHRRMRMYWEIHTLPNRRPEPNGIRK